MPASATPESTSAKLTVALWMVAFAFVAPATVLTGQVATLPEALTLFTGLATGISFALPLHVASKHLSALPTPIRLPGTVIAAFAVATLQTAADYAGQHAVSATFGHVQLPPMDPRSVILVALIYFCIYGANAAVFWVVDSLQRTREKELELANSRARAAVLEMEMLRLQLDPHFLGNALNGISTLILGGREGRAAEMTDRLAAFLRASIEDRGRAIPLAEELDILSAYVDVEAARFGDRLDVRMICDEAMLGALVPPLILQPLVENAVKHAVAVSTRLVRIDVTAARDGDDLLLEVSDDGQTPRPASGGPQGIGLRNARSRLALQHGDRATLTAGGGPGGFRVSIRMPFEPAAS